jgi:hypothetical protein
VEKDREAAFLAARGKAIAAIAAAVGGLLDSSLYRGTVEGEWVEMVTWCDLPTAIRGSEVAQTLPEALEYFACMAEALSFTTANRCTKVQKGTDVREVLYLPGQPPPAQSTARFPEV